MTRRYVFAALIAGLGLALVAGDGQAQSQGKRTRSAYKGAYVIGSQSTTGQQAGFRANFVDNDGDGVCDYQGNAGRGHMGAKGKRGNGGHGNRACRFVDADGDGICDFAGTRGRGFVDEDGDGICDLRGANGRGFVDADNDGINDNSPLAQLNLTDGQKAEIAKVRVAGPGPHRDAILDILTPEQLAQLEALRAERRAQRMGNQRGQRRWMNNPPTVDPQQ